MLMAGSRTVLQHAGPSDTPSAQGPPNIPLTCAAADEALAACHFRLQFLSTEDIHQTAEPSARLPTQEANLHSTSYPYMARDPYTPSSMHPQSTLTSRQLPGSTRASSLSTLKKAEQFGTRAGTHDVGRLSSSRSKKAMNSRSRPQSAHLLLRPPCGQTHRSLPCSTRPRSQDERFNAPVHQRTPDPTYL